MGHWGWWQGRFHTTGTENHGAIGAVDLASHALAHSSIDVLRAVPGLREALVSVVRALEKLDASMRSLFGLVREIATIVTHKVGAFG